MNELFFLAPNTGICPVSAPFHGAGSFEWNQPVMLAMSSSTGLTLIKTKQNTSPCGYVFIDFRKGGKKEKRE